MWGIFDCFAVGTLFVQSQKNWCWIFFSSCCLVGTYKRCKLCCHTVIHTVYSSQFKHLMLLVIFFLKDPFPSWKPCSASIPCSTYLCVGTFKTSQRSNSNHLLVLFVLIIQNKHVSWKGTKLISLIQFYYHFIKMMLWI